MWPCRKPEDVHRSDNSPQYLPVGRDEGEEETLTGR